MTTKIGTFLKAINDRMTGGLPSDTVKNPKLNVNPISSVLSARFYPMEDPQSSFQPLNSINAIKSCSKQTNNSQKDQPQVKTLTVNENRTPKPKELEQTLKDEFKNLYLNLLVLSVLAHALIYNAILDKYEENLKLGKNGSAFIQGKMPKKIKDPRLFTLPCRLGDSKPFDTLANLGTCVNLIPLYVFKKLKIRLLEETDHVFGLADGTKSYPVGIVKIVEEKESYETRPSADGIGARPPYYAKKDFMDYQLSGEWEIARDAMQLSGGNVEILLMDVNC
ncbi:hypothetical protein Tco_1401328 [Tanacetum coccineum]